MLQDLRYAVRMLTKSPGFTAVAVLTLALGLGANAAVFSVFNAYFVRVLPFPQPHRLVHIWATVPQREFGDQARVSFSNFLDWRARARSFEQLGAYYYTLGNVSADERTLQMQVTKLTTNLPGLLGVSPVLGRTFADGEDQPGRNRQVLLSYAYWQRHFNSDSHVLGQTVRLDGENYSVIGVMPESFVFPLKATQMWVPLTLAPDEAHRGEHGPLLVVGRLKPDVGIGAAQAEMQNITRALAVEYPAANKDTGAHVVSLPEALLFFYDQLRLMFLGLLLATIFILLIVCSNLGNLLVARAIERAREVAVRTALGATRLRIIRQLITESTVLALLGGAVGTVLATWAVALLDTNMPPDLYRTGAISVDWRVLVFTFVISLLAACLFGAAPALLVSRPQLSEALKEGGRSGLGVKSRRLHNVLVVAETAVAMVLLAGAIFSAHSFIVQRRQDPGFNASGILTMRTSLPRGAYPDAARIDQFYRDILARVEALPGVGAAATVDPLPMNFELDTQQFAVEGQQGSPQKMEAATFTVSPDYFRAMQIPILQGSTFTERNVGGAPAVVIVNRLLADRNWPGEEPVGKQIRLFDDRGGSRVATVVAVAGNSKDFLMNQQLRPQIYFPRAQSPSRSCFLTIKASGDPAALTAAVRREIEAVDKNVSVADGRSMERVLMEALSPFMFAAGILGLLGIGALLLAAMGIYGVISYGVRQRTHEIGVRMALGARQQEIVRMVLGQGGRLAATGLVIGFVGTLALMQVVRALLLGSAFDPYVLIGAPLLLTGVGLLASFVPARRASRVDPMVALRYE